MQARSPDNAQGIDVSYFQGVIDWKQVREAGKSFAMIKATEGRSIVDGRLQTNVEGARAAGVLAGVYHFCRAASVAEAQQEAAFFCSVLDGLGGIKAIDIPPVLDIEVDNGLSGDEITANCQTWLEAVEAHYGVQPLFYTYPYFADTYLTDAMGRYKLWLADYADHTPSDHCGCTEWTFLQYSCTGSVPGIAGPVDLNEFMGSEDMLFDKMNAQIAADLIATCKAMYALAASDADRQKWHNSAEELRRVSGLPADA